MRFHFVLPLLALVMAGCTADPTSTPAEIDAATEAIAPPGPLVQSTTVELLPMAQAADVYPVLTGASVGVDEPEDATAILFEARLASPAPPLPSGRLRLGSDSGPIGENVDTDGDGIYRIEFAAEHWRGTLGVALTPEGPAGAHAGGQLEVRVTAFFAGVVPAGHSAF